MTLCSLPRLNQPRGSLIQIQIQSYTHNGSGEEGELLAVFVEGRVMRLMLLMLLWLVVFRVVSERDMTCIPD